MASVGVRDLDVAHRFYAQTLGLDVRDERPFALSMVFGSAMLRITAIHRPAAVPYTVLGWSVPDIHGAVDDLAGRGVDFTRCPGVAQDERGVWTAPGGARIAWSTDPDGAVRSLAQL